MTAPSSVHSRRFWLQSQPLSVGVGLVVLTVAVSELLPPSLAADLHAMVLVFIAAQYAGFASLDGGGRAMAMEFAGIGLFCGLAVLGLWVCAPIQILGYAGHAAWDTLHHPESGFGATIIGWYVPFCVVYDILVASYLVVVYLG
jgi:hypothetical protein